MSPIDIINCGILAACTVQSVATLAIAVSLTRQNKRSQVTTALSVTAPSAGTATTRMACTAARSTDSPDSDLSTRSPTSSSNCPDGDVPYRKE